MEQEEMSYQEATPSCSQPLHIKRIERALNLNIVLQQQDRADSTDEDYPITIDDDSDEGSGSNAKLDNIMNGKLISFI